MEPRRVHFGLNPISEIRGDSPVAPVRPVPRIPADPTEYSATERELGIEDDSDDEPIFVANQRGRMVQTGEPLDSMTSNIDGTMFCAGGSRGVLKVFSIHDDNTLAEACNFRRIKSKRLTLLYSPLAVAWNHNLPNQIGTTSTNGAVVFWDIERQCLDFHFKEHKRSATSLQFHPTEKDILISSSKDATVLLYDIRVGKSTSKYASGSFDAVRDLQWCMHDGQEHLFNACDDSGTVRLWDRRRIDKPYLVFHAHHGLVSSAQFAPKSRFLIATGGGRDKFIKIWDWSRSLDDGPVYSIETGAPVGKALWRPHGDGSFQLASCSVVNDTLVHFWDVRRPFFPYASFSDHKDSVVALAFLQHDELRFVSGGKDGLVILNDFRCDARRPIEYANDVSLDTAPDGLIGVA
uniref:GATOR2 complex protein WDR24 n=1 Tax=Pristionchus pacificus TaxID=54126 RepID=A0A2A6BPY5_PRIPA